MQSLRKESVNVSLVNSYRLHKPLQVSVVKIQCNALSDNYVILHAFYNRIGLQCKCTKLSLLNYLTLHLLREVCARDQEFMRGGLDTRLS